MNRSEYVEQEIQFKNSVPKNAQNELRLLLPGLCAQESRFNNNVKSGKGAMGIFEFMPGTWKELQAECLKEDIENGIKNPVLLNINSLKDQTRAAGRHFSEIYRLVYHYAELELEHIQKIFFPAGGFEKYFLVPLMINSYNAGEKRLSDAVILFASQFKDAPQATEHFRRDIRYLGYDVFYTLTQLASQSRVGTLGGYDVDSSEYFSKVFANNELVHITPKASADDHIELPPDALEASPQVYQNPPTKSLRPHVRPTKSNIDTSNSNNSSAPTSSLVPKPRPDSLSN